MNSEICSKLSALCLILIFNFSFLIFNCEANATIRYVSHTGSSTPPYTSWETAADSIQKAIDICIDGDTVIVANGVYYESVYVNKTINLWGSSMDSTVIDGTNISGFDILYFFENNSTFKNFTINSSNPQRNGIVTRNSNLVAEFCKIINLEISLNVNFSSIKITNFVIRFYTYGIRDECPADTCRSVYTNNIIIAESNLETPVVFTYGGYPTFTNNIVIGAGNLRGVDIQYHKKTIVKNNLVAGNSGVNVDIGQIRVDTAYVENNNSFNSGVAYHTSSPGRTIIKNNIAKDVFRGVQTGNGTVIPDYNLFWNVQELVSGALLGDSCIVADPMFVKDTIPNSQLDFDYHLQAYSPAIDKGDSEILDVDGSRSDIGMFGGPLGERYTYKDLPPKHPVNLSAIIDTNYILLKWNKNSEADTSHYNVYRDTVINFMIDSTKLISSPADTFFIHFPPYNSSQYVYKVTCVDNQGNESLPSEEVIIKTTSIDEYPVVVNDYILYQNYPNPFNLSTTIGYKLKERGYVKLMVYDIKGELISVLVNKEQEAGYYEVEFNGRNLINQIRTNDLASGIYLYRIEVIGKGNIPVYSDMQKMILIK
jgi:hypothetical protein